MIVRKFNFIFSLVFVALAVSSFIFYKQSSQKFLKVVFLDVGQGDAIFIETPNGNQMLIDGGADAKILRELGTVMPFYDRFIDVVLETHPDKDHVGGLPDVFKRYDVGVFLEPGVSSENLADDALLEEIKNHEVKKIIARRNMSVNLGSSVVFEILFPDRDASFLESNTASVVGRLRYSDFEVMLTGDSPASIENHLVSLGAEGLSSDVLKAGHHGSKTSSGKNFVEAVSPELVVISSGKNNRYGHPSLEVVSLFEELGIKILNTADNGRIEIISDGQTFKIK